ncbi:TetR/AcrR family transcriptional regulator [Arenibaculum pallidiluteum]|uniref:TetR/AcrR family transcriptional regulator n=1 Tax=Arenibaculum pallidiluteum TaxID=2812559 RepID=UPI001A964A7C|nr:TetR/AcrR family transcriptional regulator [Arenibaculum pallidiluteum]
MARVVAGREDVLQHLGEVFRTQGFEGASLAAITAATGLGKGSLYHFFPGGKDEMAEAVLDAIEAWFRDRVFAPLRDGTDPAAGIACMLDETDRYFRSGRRVCLVGAFALGEVRDRFASRIRRYFAEWRDALAEALARAGHPPAEAQDMAEEAVAAIQGALVLARATDDAAVFARALSRLRTRLLPR